MNGNEFTEKMVKELALNGYIVAYIDVDEPNNPIISVVPDRESNPFLPELARDFRSKEWKANAGGFGNLDYGEMELLIAGMSSAQTACLVLNGMVRCASALVSYNYKQSN